MFFILISLFMFPTSDSLVNIGIIFQWFVIKNSYLVINYIRFQMLQLKHLRMNGNKLLETIHFKY